METVGGLAGTYTAQSLQSIICGPDASPAQKTSQSRSLIPIPLKQAIAQKYTEVKQNHHADKYQGINCRKVKLILASFTLGSLEIFRSG